MTCNHLSHCLNSLLLLAFDLTLLLLSLEAGGCFILPDKLGSAERLMDAVGKSLVVDPAQTLVHSVERLLSMFLLLDEVWVWRGCFAKH